MDYRPHVYNHRHSKLPNNYNHNGAVAAQPLPVMLQQLHRPVLNFSLTSDFLEAFPSSFSGELKDLVD
jgi:hypothetical protein